MAAVYAYSLAKLLELLIQNSQMTASQMAATGHSVYFESYFRSLGAKTIVVEAPYVDRYFLEDFAGYYVKCATKYNRDCVRLHFFKHRFTKNQFENLVLGRAGKLSVGDLETSYLGFIVVKPLPSTVVGRTCLATYESHPRTRRHFPIVRAYEVNLYGIPLKVRTIAFQSQDSVAAACATSALWTAFHVTGKRFHHAIPSPFEITRNAVENLPLEGPVFPNHGLDMAQMAQAVRKIGLDPHVISARDTKILKRTVYAYLSGGVPVILGIELYQVLPDLRLRLVGHHAATITGFHLPDKRPMGNGSSMVADSIDKIYVHDDQVGPFARMEFRSGDWLLENKEQYLKKTNLEYLTTSFGGIDRYVALPKVLLVPLDSSLRIPYERVHDLLVRFNRMLQPFMDWRPDDFGHLKATWDIELVEIGAYKRNIRLSNRSIKKEHKLELLTESLPCFLWKATAWRGKQRMMDLLFDTTDVEQGRILLRAVARNNNFARDIQLVCKVMRSMPDASLNYQDVWPFIRYFTEVCSPTAFL